MSISNLLDRFGTFARLNRGRGSKVQLSSTEAKLRSDAKDRKRGIDSVGREMDYDLDIIQTPPEKRLRANVDDTCLKEKSKPQGWTFDYSKLWNFVVKGKGERRVTKVSGKTVEPAMETKPIGYEFDKIYDPKKYATSSQRKKTEDEDIIEVSDETDLLDTDLTILKDAKEVTRHIPESCRRLSKTHRSRIKRIKPQSDNNAGTDQIDTSLLFQTNVTREDIQKSFLNPSRTMIQPSYVNGSSLMSNTETNDTLQSTNFRPQERKTTTAQNVIRLEERERYRQLVSQFTSVNIKAENTGGTNAASRPRDRPSKGRLSKVDRILQQFSSVLPDVSVRNLQEEKTIGENSRLSEVVSASDETTCSLRNEEASATRTFDGADKSNQLRTSKSTEVATDAFDTSWIRKWRDVLSPEELNREKRIKREERRLKDLKEKRKEDDEAKGKKKDELPVLSAEMNAQIDAALMHGNISEQLCEGFNAAITRGDIKTLTEKNWLNDEVINFYMSLLKERSNQETLPNIHVFNTFFYPKLLRTGYSGVKRWTKKVDIFSMDLIILPIHLGMHWCLAVVDFRKKSITYYDSLKGNNLQCIETLRSYLQHESKEKKKTPYEFSGWTELMAKDIPEQLNGCDCGVFTCKYAEYITRDAPLTFTQSQMPYFRRRMVYEILNKKLL